ncbi:MAG: hypothetical protein ACLVJZ_07120 [[Clostridium] leptum]
MTNLGRPSRKFQAKAHGRFKDRNRTFQKAGARGLNAKPNRQKIIRKEVVAMFKFLCKAAGMVAVTALILRLGEAVSNRVCGKQHSIKIIGRPKEAGSIGIIGGADGPTAIFISGRANPQAVSNVFSRLAGVVKARWNRLWA